MTITDEFESAVQREVTRRVQSIFNEPLVERLEKSLGIPLSEENKKLLADFVTQVACTGMRIAQDSIQAGVQIGNTAVGAGASEFIR